jgi:broad specificity phosphatase PhoE
MNNMVKIFRTKTMLLVVSEHILRVLFWFFYGLPEFGKEQIVEITNGTIYEFETDNIPSEIKDFKPLSDSVDSGDSQGAPDRLLSQAEIDALIAELSGG